MGCSFKCCPPPTATPSDIKLPSDLYDALKVQSFELSDLETLCVNSDVVCISNPLLVCITTKVDPKTCLNNLSKPEYLRIINGSTHRDISKQIKDIIWKDLICDKPQYDGLIITLQCICAFSGETLKFVYDRAEEPRQIDKLRQDIIPRLEDTAVWLDYSKAIRFQDGCNGQTRLGPNNDHSRPNGQLVNWKPPKNRAKRRRGAKPKSQEEKPSNQDDAKEVEQSDM